MNTIYSDDEEKYDQTETKYNDLTPIDEADGYQDIEFQFCVDDSEYLEVLRELKGNELECTGSDLEDDSSEIKINCPHQDCKRAFSRKHNLLKHLKSHELGIDKQSSICHVCGKTVKGVYSLHLKIHDVHKNFRCDTCGREFRQKVALNNHLLIHRNEKPFVCPYCSKSFRQKYTMQHHMKNRHTGIKEHICELCGKEFSDNATLRKHTLVHSTSKPYQCSVCFMSFRHKSSLSRHSKIHNKVTECIYCKKSFRYESFLKKHLLTCHSGQEVLIDYILPKDESKEGCLLSYEDQVENTAYVQQPVSINNLHASYS